MFLQSRCALSSKTRTEKSEKKKKKDFFLLSRTHSSSFFFARPLSAPPRCLCFFSPYFPNPDGKGHGSACLLSGLKKRARKAYEAGGGRERAVFSLSKKNHRPTVIKMSGFLSLLGLAPPPQRPSPARYQSPAREDRPAPEFSLAELRRVHGVLLVSFFLSFSIGSNQSSDGEIQGTPTLTHRRQTSPPPPRPTAS